MRTETDKSETRKWLEPTVAKYEREFSQCYNSIGKKLLKILEFRNSHQNGPEYEKIG